MMDAPSSRRSKPSTALYIADGHHRAASAARARDAVRESDEAGFFLAVAFPSDQLRILPYNRVVRDLNGMTPEHFLGEVARHFAMTSGLRGALRGRARSRCIWPALVFGRSRERRRCRHERHRQARRQRSSAAGAGAHPRHQGRPHRHANRFRWRRQGHEGRSSSSWTAAEWRRRSRCIPSASSS